MAWHPAVTCCQRDAEHECGAAPITAAWEVDLLDENEQPISTDHGAARLGFRGFEVKTTRVRVR